MVHFNVFLDPLYNSADKLPAPAFMQTEPVVNIQTSYEPTLDGKQKIKRPLFFIVHINVSPASSTS